MQISTTIYTPKLAEKAAMLRQAGYEACDYGGPMQYYFEDKTIFQLDDSEYDDLFRREGEILKAAGLRVRQVHAPYHTIPDDESETPYMRKCILRSPRAVHMAGGEILVIHPAQLMHWETDVHPEKTKAYNRALFEEILTEAHRWNVKIALENMPGAGVPAGVPGSQIEYIDMMGDPDYFGACFDSGHANYSRVSCGEFIRQLGKRLFCVHLHDNHRNSDEHLGPFMGTIDWQDMANALREIGYTGTWSYEATFPYNFPEGMRDLPLKFQWDVAKRLCERAGL